MRESPRPRVKIKWIAKPRSLSLGQRVCAWCYMITKINEYFLIYSTQINRKNNQFGLGQCLLKINDFTTPAWKKSGFGEKFSKVRDNTISKLLRLLWKSLNFKQKAKVIRTPSRSSLTTFSRGPIARKKQSREQLGCSFSGWTIKLPQTNNFLKSVSSFLFNSSLFNFFKNLIKLSTLAYNFDSNLHALSRYSQWYVSPSLKSVFLF